MVPGKQKCCICAYVVLLLICVHNVGVIAGSESEVPRISAQQVKKILGNSDTVIIDVRRYRNWWRSSKKISTAVREDPSRVDQWIKKYARNKTLIFYCS